MGRGSEIPEVRAVAPQGEPGGCGGGVCAPRAEIVAPGAFEPSAPDVCAVHLADLARAGYPCLRRGMVVTVQRPWSWRHLLLSALAWGIRRESAKIGGRPARASHAMLYVGGGNVASQNMHYEITSLAEYRGCILRFWDVPTGSQTARNELVAETLVYVGRDYGWRDVLAQYLRAATGNPAWLAAMSDPRNFNCSEAVCRLLRQWAVPFFGGDGTCDKTPQELEDWMTAAGWPMLALRLV